MAYSRSFMKSLGLSEDQITALMDEHLAVVNELKRQRDEFQQQLQDAGKNAEKLKQVQAELDTLREGNFQEKYAKEHQDFEAYKADIAKKEEAAKVRGAYRDLLAAENIAEKYRDTILNATPFDGIKLDENGGLSEADQLRKTIREKWADFVETTQEQGAKVPTPPNPDKNTFGAMSLTEKMAYANRNPNAPEVTEWLSK